MSGYDWETIFKSKTEKELLKIYTGNSHLNFEAQVYAALELKRRDYNFNTIKDFHSSKIESLKNDITEFNNLTFKKSDYYKQQFIYFFGIIIILVYLITSDFKQESTFTIYKALIYLVIFIFSILTAKWNYNRFRKNKAKKLKEKTELLDKLSKVIPISL